MAKVSLRIYNRDVESLVDQGQLDEAIAHCRHILSAFPKHLETYRLLGKAYLEAKRYPEATDIFQRLMMAVPDDFVAHVGMSIICDEQNKMDDAIWHMERAFEVQPSNSAIQAELQRLYGRRDGVEPPKIRLTRGALAHMYMQGELYAQAISEIKKVLEEDPNRQDMQVLLARAYFHAGQKTESAEICDQLLRRYPYCLDANRVLVELLPETDRGESTQVYRQRVNELDPYAAFVRESLFRTDDAPDAAVSLDRLDWNGQPVTMEADWGSSLGIGAGSAGAERDEQPAWLRSSVAGESPSASFPTETPVSSPQGVPAASGDTDIPDFLREAGWGESSGSFQESPAPFGEAQLPELAEGDLPDWVKAMAPTKADAGKAEVPFVEKASDASDEEVPDWLREIKEGETPQAAQPFEQTDLRDWLPSEKIQEDAAALAGAGALAFDALAGQEPEAGQPGEEEAGAAPVAFDATDTGELGASAGEQDESFAWLEGLAAKHGAKSEELLTKPEERLESEPDWVQQAKSLGAEAEVSSETVAPPAEPPVEEPPFEEAQPDDLPDFLKQVMQPGSEPAPASAFDSVDTGDLGASAGEQDESFAWLEGLAAKHGAKSEELLTKPEERLEREPGWVQQAKDLGASQPAEELPAGVDETGVWLRDLEASGPEAQPAAQPDQPIETPAWQPEAEPAAQPGQPVETSAWQPEAEPVALEAEAETGAQEDAGVGTVWESGESVSPGAVEQRPPAWLRDLEAETETLPVGEKKVEDLPDWLAGLDEEKAPEPASPAEALPEWLRGTETEAEPASPEPVGPSDWMPVETGVPEPSVVAPPVEEKAAPPPYHEPPTRSRSGMTGMLSTARDVTLSQAQIELSRGNIPGAMEVYGKLIKKGRLLDEVIFDLREALYRYPVEVIVWQALGDAYLRANRLQDALDAYTKAEELLR
ncbi:MAG: tetratricopeptide repeat protein [Chloroflexota bacterium]